MQKQVKRTQSRTLHTIQVVGQKSTPFIARLQRARYVQTPPQISPRVRTPTPIRKIINTFHFKTQTSEIDQTIVQQPIQEMKNSLFQFVTSHEFQNLKQEEKKQKKDEEIIILDAPMYRKEQKKQAKIFNYEMKKSNSKLRASFNFGYFLKKIQQIITMSKYRQDASGSESVLFSEKFIQTVSPPLTFTNKLSTIQLKHTIQLKTQGTQQMMDTLIEQKVEKPVQVQLSKKKIKLTVNSPENQETTSQFTIPLYCLSQEEEEQQQYSDPKHVLRQAANLLSNQKKEKFSKFSSSILKIVGLREDDDKKEEDQPINSQKTRRFLKLYMQNKFQKCFSQLEEDILILINKLSDLSSFIVKKDSPQTSRLLSNVTNQLPSPTLKASSQKIFLIIECKIFKNKQKMIERLLTPSYQNLDEMTFQDEQISILDYDEKISEGYEIYSMLDISNCMKSQIQQYLLFIISNLDDNSRNYLLSDESTLEDNTMLKKTLKSYMQSQFNQFINYQINKIKQQDRVLLGQQIFQKYNDILSGIFEDEHEINNMSQELQLLEEQKEHSQQPTSILLPPIKIIPTKKNDGTPTSSDKTRHSKTIQPNPNQNPNQNQKHMQPSPKNQQRHPQKKSSLLEANAHQVLSRKDSPSIQEETSKTSKDDNSNMNNTTQSKLKAATTILTTIKPFFKRQVSVSTSMTKHSLLMRTNLDEAQRNKKRPISEVIKLLIEEQKFNELNELLANNPNIFINERCLDGNTYLIIAAQTGAVEIVELLLFKGALVNLQNSDGDTALHKAIAYNFYRVADLLIQNGAQVVKNNKGLTAWQLVQ